MSWKTVLERFQTRDPTMDEHEEMMQRAGQLVLLCRRGTPQVTTT